MRLGGMSVNLKDKKTKARETFSKLLEMPSDVMMDLPKVTMVGGMQVLIENHRGIIEFGTDKVRIAVSTGEIKILGRQMVLKGIFVEEVVIEGEISSINLVK